MANHDIQTSQHLLKKLEEEIIAMRELMRQLQVISHNMDGTWTAISVTQRNWRRKLEEEVLEKIKNKDMNL